MHTPTRSTAWCPAPRPCKHESRNGMRPQFNCHPVEGDAAGHNPPPPYIYIYGPGSVGPPSPATSAAPIPHSLMRPRTRAHAPAPVSPRAIFALQGIFGGRMPCVGRRRLSGSKRDVHTASEKSTRASEMHGGAHTRSRSRAHADALTNALAHAFQPTAHHSQSVSRTRAHACKHARMG